jgi:hypothetical protein
MHPVCEAARYESLQQAASEGRAVVRAAISESRPKPCKVYAGSKPAYAVARFGCEVEPCISIVSRRQSFVAVNANALPRPTQRPAVRLAEGQTWQDSFLC